METNNEFFIKMKCARFRENNKNENWEKKGQ